MARFSGNAYGQHILKQMKINNPFRVGDLSYYEFSRGAVETRDLSDAGNQQIATIRRSRVTIMAIATESTGKRRAMAADGWRITTQLHQGQLCKCFKFQARLADTQA